MNKRFKSAKYPFNDFILYGPRLHEKEGRYYVVLVSKVDKTKICTSYARYIMQVKLKRFLMKKEHVDHIDGNKLNDNESNLQILSAKENNIKYIKQSGKSLKAIEKICCVCGKSFLMKNKNKRIKTCSRSCGGKISIITAKSNGYTKIAQSAIDQIRSLRKNGLSVYKINALTGVSRNTIMKYWNG